MSKDRRSIISMANIVTAFADNLLLYKVILSFADGREQRIKM